LFDGLAVPQMKAKKNVKIGDTKLVDNSIIEIIAK